MRPINTQRTYFLNQKEQRPGPVIYWMSREQRVLDNWSLLHSRELAGNAPLVVGFCLVPTFLGATLRQYDFMLRGLEEVEQSLKKLGIGFHLRLGDPAKEMVSLVRELNAGCVVTDFDPLRIKQQWQQAVAKAIPVSMIEVDGHNVVPARVVSDKQEYAARTIRPKIHRNSEIFLEPFPKLTPPAQTIEATPIDWEKVRQSIKVDTSVAPVSITPGEKAAHKALKAFIRNDLQDYAERRNDPTAEATSGLSPYYHFGQLAPQRAALEVAATGKGEGQAVYLEELIIRRELSDNFCLYNPHYDSLKGAPDWALKTLDEHREDPRPYTYSYKQFEQAATHSRLWNAAQTQLLRSGTMHGYMRMFWAKKILEWSATPEEAYDTAITLNDRYQLDGRDPNGYVGVLWSLAGVHDRPWQTRPIYGSVRYMNENGCRRKFKVDVYCDRWLQGNLLA